MGLFKVAIFATQNINYGNQTNCLHLLFPLLLLRQHYNHFSPHKKKGSTKYFPGLFITKQVLNWRWRLFSLFIYNPGKGMQNPAKALRAFYALAFRNFYVLQSLVIVSSFLVPQLIQAQSKPLINSTLQGRVTDARTKEPLAGVTIRIEGVTNQTQTDAEGRFTLITGQSFPYNLFISFVGYQDIKVTAAGSPLAVELKEVTNDLNGVVVVGYGTRKRGDVTGAISSVPQVALKQPVSSLDQALKGAATGVQVTQTSGQPGGGVSIRIRGGASIQGGNEPLYVIDGFPLYNSSSATGVLSGTPVNPLASINPADIESVDILKDASATAIYGSRGANGVVIITTKKGKADRNTVNFETSLGTQSVRKKIDVLGAKDFAILRNEVLYSTTPASGKYQYLSQQQIDQLGEGTNWQNAAFRRAPLQSHQLSVSGGSAKVQYLLSGNYYKQEGIIRNTDFSRLSLRANIDAKPGDHLKTGASFTVSRSNSNIAPSGIVGSLLIMPPTATIYEPDGSYTLRNPFENIFANPIATINETINKSALLRLLGTAYAEYTIGKHVAVKVLAGADVNNQKDKYYVPSTIYEGSGTKGSASLGSANYNSWLNENTITYNQSFGKHTIDALAGFTQQEATNESFTAGAQTFVSDDLTYNNLGSGSTLVRPASDTYSWVLHSWLARVNYSYNNLYYLTGSVRRDGSSRFGKNNKWGSFPSLAASWRVSNEGFFKPLLKHITDLKIRSSFGTTGNLEIGQYQSLSTLYSLNYILGGTALTGFAPNRIPNDNLGWETTYQYDGGIDIGLFSNRLLVSLDAYYKKTTDLLLNVEIPWTTGYASSLQNYGSVENKGLELGIKTKNIVRKNFTWETDLNISFNRNKVLAIGNGASSYISGNYIIQVGQPLGAFYGTVTDGILQTGEVTAKGKYTGSAAPQPGDRLYKDVSGDGSFTTAADRAIIGNAQPDYIFGITNNVSWKGFDLSVLLQGVYGNQIINTNRQTLEMFTGQQNASVTALERWTETNPGNTIPRAKLDPAPIFSDRFVEDGSFLRVKNVNLAYALPKSLLAKANLTAVSVFVSAQNLLTFTRYTGFDPEVTSGSNVSPGTDSGIYPVAKTFNAGLRISF